MQSYPTISFSSDAEEFKYLIATRDLQFDQAIDIMCKNKGLKDERLVSLLRSKIIKGLANQ